MQCIAGCDSPNPNKHKTFEQPVVQTLQMFIGESGCWLVVLASYLYRRFAHPASSAYQPVSGDDEPEDLGRSSTLSRGHAPDDEIDPTDAPFKPFADAELVDGQRMPLKGWKIVLLALPACCDIAGTTLMNVGLLFVAASIYQMTRGALVLFVGLFSVLFLKKHLGPLKWASLFVVVLGVAVVGLAGALEQKIPAVPGKENATHHLQDSSAPFLLHASREVYRQITTAAKEHSAAQTVIGIFLIAGAQIFTASQFVIEENIMAKYELDPLATVGWEGVFGFLVTLVGMAILHLAVGRTDAGRGGYFDAETGLSQLVHNRAIAVSSVLIMISIG